MHICVFRSASYTRASILFLSILGSSIAVTGCGDPTRNVGAAHSALTAEQCSFFEADGGVQICHRTSSINHPFTIIRTSVQGCIDGHAGHGLDFAAVGDPTCQGGGCLPEAAPCDASLPCCSGATCQGGTCVHVCTPTTCEAQSVECDSILDGCGDTLDCGSCAEGSTCQAGQCQAGCACPPIFVPVCDTSTNTTYANQCEADCAGVDPANVAEGPCPVAANCPCAASALWTAALSATNPVCSVTAIDARLDFENGFAFARSEFAQCIAAIGMEDVFIINLSVADAEVCVAQLTAACQ